MQNKIRELKDISNLIAEEQKNGQRIVHCHGVFDLLHPGHLRHLQEAKSQGDKLIVSLTPDRFVNKGPGRPAFGEKLRMEQLAALVYVDFVVLNDSPDAVSIIKKIRPNVYAKGKEYSNHNEDITNKISEEAEAVASFGGQVYYTDDIVFSSSELINRFFDEDAARIAPFIDSLKRKFSLAEILERIAELDTLKVLVVGDAIIDEYQYVDPLGQSGKGVHLAAKLLEKEIFLGGALIVCNHLSSFCKNVTLLTGVGRNCAHLPFIRDNLAENVESHFIYFDAFPTLTKTRFVLKDGKALTKLFELYSSNESLLEQGQTETVLSFIKERASDFDLVLACDFGNGFSNSASVHALCSLPNFLAVNTQINSGNRGYNVVTHYTRADFISLNEPELRLAAHDRTSRLEMVAADIAQLLSCSQISVTRGVQGVYLHHAYGAPIYIPALTTHAVDRVGAGDSYFALASLCAAHQFPLLLTGFIGSAAAAMGVQIVGNREAISKIGLCKYITRLMK